MSALKEHIVFVGIGGIGMSAIARHFLRSGLSVFGYDKTPTTLTKELEAEGAQITYEEELSCYPGWSPEETTVIYTPAIPATNAWMTFFQPYSPIKRAAALGLLAQGKRTLAVAGTHGKTSTSAMLVHILTEAGLDPTAFVGGIMKGEGTNYRLGEGPWLIVEADEFDRSFLHLHPEAAAITTTDADHLDIYGNADTLLNTFIEFQNQVDGPVFSPSGLQGTMSTGTPGDAIWASAVEAKEGAFHFILNTPSQQLPTALYMPGHHNVSNALLAAALAIHAGVPLKVIATALQTFRGIKRRFEFHATAPVVIIEDYAHHPTEIKALLDGVEELYPNTDICICFQPHLYSRTRDFMEGFKIQLSRAKATVLLPIYPARELPIEGISSTALASDIPGAIVVEKEGLATAVAATRCPIILVVGAGDIGDFVPQIKAQFA